MMPHRFPLAGAAPKTTRFSLIHYEHYQLPNGLTVLLYPQPQRTVASVQVLYRVGSRNDPPTRTGLAHLFEHLMFGGSENVPNFDDALQLAGGENNALTGADYTLYYDTVPAANVATALFLEADRMRAVNLNARALANEKKVVVEEFKETCLEEPYGDLYHHLGELIYSTHPYRYPVIGRAFADIENVTLEEAREFYLRYYRPDNATLVVAGGYDPADIRRLIEQYFGDIPPAPPELPRPTLPEEPPQEGFRQKIVRGDVPSPVIYLNYRTPGRFHPDFAPLDVLVFLLGNGRSSYLHKHLVRDGDLFAELSAGHNDTLDSGAIVIEARPAEEADWEEARAALYATIERFAREGITEAQLEKVINRLEHGNLYKRLSVGGIAGELAFFGSAGQPERVNNVLAEYRAVTVADVERVIRTYLRPEVLSELQYLVEEEEE